MEVKIISGYGENTFQMDDADTMSLLNNAMRFHNKIKAIDGVEDNTGIKAEKEEEIKESITAQEFVKRMQEKPHSRNDSLFGTGWKKEPEKTEEPQDMEHPDGYKGFLYIKCDTCGSPVDVKMNSRRTAYITIGGVLKVIAASWLGNMVHQLVAGKRKRG